MTIKMVDSGMFSSCSEEAFDAASAVVNACELLVSSRGESESAAGPVSCWSNGFPVSPEVALSGSASVEAAGGEAYAVGLVTCSVSCSLFSVLFAGTTTFCGCFLPLVHVDPISLGDVLRQ